MNDTSSTNDFSIRPATQADDKTIREIISLVGINRMGLAWQRFILAVDPSGKVIGCGQVKPHGDGTAELASIAVLPEWRGKGVARKIIERLLEQHPGRLYLTCRTGLKAMYQKFGFQVLDENEMTPYFKRISRVVSLFIKLLDRSDRLLVMRRN